VILAQGDEAACREAEAMFPGVTTACVKRALAPDTCEGPDPAAARRLTAEKVAEAIESLRSGRCRPFQPTLPVTVTVTMATPEKAEAAASKPGVERLDEHRVQHIAERRSDVVNWIVGAGLDMPPT
jgi:D-amino peptidase